MSDLLYETSKVGAFAIAHQDLILKALRTCGDHFTADTFQSRLSTYEQATATSHASERAECNRSAFADAIEINSRLTP